MFKLDNFGVILFASFSYTKLLQCSFYKNLKNRFFRKKFKKVCVLQRRACNKFKHNYLENYNDSEHAVKTKNAPFFMIFPNISFFHMVVTDCTGPLKDEQNLLQLPELELIKVPPIKLMQLPFFRICSVIIFFIL